jgi:hypothetical protein
MLTRAAAQARADRLYSEEHAINRALTCLLSMQDDDDDDDSSAGNRQGTRVGIGPSGARRTSSPSRRRPVVGSKRRRVTGKKR